MNDILSRAWEVIIAFGGKAIVAVVIFLVGWWVAKLVARIIETMMMKANVEKTVISFVGNLAYIAVLVFVVLAALGKLGIPTTSFVAVVGAAGLAIGLALQGSLANFAAGFLMIVFRPFKVGDYIEGAGVGGAVEKIQIFTTQLITPDNKTIIIPNSKIMGDNIINYSAKAQRRIDLVFGVSYSDDINKVKQIISEVMSEEKRILQDPAPSIALMELADSSVNFAVRPWVNTENYWSVRFDLIEAMKKRFDDEGITIPFPQQDVYVHRDQGEKLM